MKMMLAVGATAALGAVALSLAVIVTVTGQTPTTPAAPATLCPTHGPAADTQTVAAAAADEAQALRARTTTATDETAPAAIPYELPAVRGKTGREEPIDRQGRVPSTGATITFASLASRGSAYRDFYITMRWTWAAWDFAGHIQPGSLDPAQYNWMAGKPRLVLVTNPRTGKSIIAAALESGPGPWVGVTDPTNDSDGARYGWPGYVRGTPAGYQGIVSGFPPAALAALDARTGYLGETGDDLTYRWAPDQNATPGPTALRSDDGLMVGAARCTPTSAAPAGYTAPDGTTVTIPSQPDAIWHDANYAGTTITAPSPAVAKGIAAGLSFLGAPYVWGGGGAAGPDDGCARAGGERNSCQHLSGFDCSGLTAYVLAVAGYDIPGDSSSQRASGTAVPWEQARPGDIIGYPGHVAVYLGTYQGQPLQLEAADVGLPVRVTTIFRDDADPVVRRYWNGSST